MRDSKTGTNNFFSWGMGREKIWEESERNSGILLDTWGLEKKLGFIVLVSSGDKSDLAVKQCLCGNRNLTWRSSCGCPCRLGTCWKVLGASVRVPMAEHGIERGLWVVPFSLPWIENISDQNRTAAPVPFFLNSVALYFLLEKWKGR